MKKDGIFTYASLDGKDYRAEYYYRDAYFMKSAYEYNPSLATMSMCLAMSAFGSNETRTPEEKDELGPGYSEYSQNAEALLTDIGFSEIETNVYFNMKPTLDTIGVVAGNKTIISDGKEYTLIAVGVRGQGYEAE